jgi:branched-chain amino acid transport system ATP-binding protein
LVIYGGLTALDGVSLEVRPGEIVALVGANGAGKTSLLKAISCLVPLARGEIRWDGQDVGARTPEAMVRAGVSHVPEGRELYPSFSVWDNLALGYYPRVVEEGRLMGGLSRRGREELRALADEVFGLFPILAARRRQRAGTLSGGEGQMLAIGRALMSAPRLLMLDEPALGLAPQVVREIMSRLVRLREDGLTILLVEQNARAALPIADRGYVLETGRVVAAGSGAELLRDPEIARAYLGRTDGPTPTRSQPT